MIKRLTKHGNSRAIVIDKAILEIAGVSEDTLFQISINPNGGLIIQSVESNSTAILEENFEKLKKKYNSLLKRLADL